MKDYIEHKLMRYYGMELLDLKRIHMGHNECFSGNGNNGSYFVKVFPIIEHMGVSNEVKYIEFLAGNFCVPQIVYTTKNDPFVVDEEEKRIILVEKYVSGIVYDYNECPSFVLNESGKLLANLHNASKKFEGNRVLDYSWIIQYRNAEVDCIKQMLSLISLNEDILYGERIATDLNIKLKMCEETQDYVLMFKTLEYGMSHGDYCCTQWIIDKDHIKCVTDFANCAEIPYVWELFRSYLQSSIECKDGYEINIETLVQYIEKYNDIRKLSLYDLLKMPYIYVCWLSASTYGYKQFLDSGNKEYLEMAFWRTKICKTVLDNAREIEKRIREVFK
ncbi:MAG: hypothetical protein IKL22_11630 [Lachnospiraceae bacterium]|nr:hypothetical protein [Lachnospiraceae bacterium]